MTAQLCDTNVWLALMLVRHIHHSVARAWFDGINEPSSVFFCRSTQLSFLRTVTTAAVFAPYGLAPLTNEEAWAVYDELIADDRIVFRADEPVGTDQQWRQFASQSAASPKLWMDAYLAAFAVAEGLQFVTADRAFRQFRGLDLLLLSDA